MKTRSARRRANRGYVSYVMVLSMGIVLLLLLMGAYKTSIRSQQAQQKVGLRVDYAQKEDGILRAIVNITPNRAIRAMQHDSDASTASRDALKWGQIFEEALVQANADQSVDADMIASFGLTDAVVGNSGDASFPNTGAIFDAIEPESGFVAPGIGRSLGLGYPPPLESNDAAVITNDRIYPIITSEKQYGGLASADVSLSVADYPNFNLIPYPEIRFGYAQPGELFLAKRNWWAFSLDLADSYDHLTGLDRTERDFIVSIYEIPSQLAISASAFTVLGVHKDGSEWQNFTMTGGAFAERLKVGGALNLDRVSGRRGIEVTSTASIGSNAYTGDAFDAGVSEQYEIDNDEFLPVYLSSEAGRAGFFPINRGTEFFDRHKHADESRTISPTTWNNYSVGALQCAMRLDVTDVAGEFDKTPTELTFQYMKNGLRETLVTDLSGNPVGGLPSGYIRCGSEGDTVNFTYPVDVAYGSNGSFYYQTGVTGDIDFNNARFGDPDVGVLKGAYYRPSYPFEVTTLNDSKHCISFYPERIEAFLDVLGGDDLDVNHSVVINTDHPGNSFILEPNIPCLDTDYGVILRECADLSAFPEGFSLVTNLRLYIADHFNTVEVAPPVGSGIPTPFFPPSSLFAPEKRFGADLYQPSTVVLSGQIGSVAEDSGVDGGALHPGDVIYGNEEEGAHDKLVMNLSPITHPAALPPITMMNWLIVVEERRAEFYVTAP